VQRLQRITPGALTAREALPDLLGLDRFGVEFRKGQTALVAAQPNDGKSALALWLSIQWALKGLRILYFSADTDEHTMWKRSAATVTGQPQSSVEHLADGRVQSALTRLKGGLSFSFETDPTYKHLFLESIAFWELWGDYPDVIVIDNLMDVVGENEDEFGTMRDTTKALKRLARATNSAVIILHHCSEQEKRTGNPPSRREITGKVSQKSEVILTLALDDQAGVLKMAPVKNRGGKKDPSGQLYHQVRVDLDRMQMYDLDYRKLGAA